MKEDQQKKSDGFFILFPYYLLESVMYEYKEINMKTIQEMDNVDVLALSKAVKDAVAKKASSGLSVGTHNVGFTVSIKGTLTKGLDYESEIVSKADPWMLLAVALSKLNGVTVDCLVREALTDDDALIESLKLKAAEAIQAIKAPTKTTCNGKVTTSLVVETA